MRKEHAVEQVTLEEAQAHLADLIKRAVRGETVLIIGNDQQSVQLVPVTSAEDATGRYLEFGSAHGLIRYMAPDFDAPLDDFKEYME
jgi:antitoxin (DNA-binding transcriptional repressor) of toxin-antitoxin stability system